MTDILGHIGSVITVAKAVSELSDRFEKSDLIEKIAELNIQLATAKNDNARLINENRELKANAERENIDPLHWTGSIYRNSADHPFCPACFDDRHKRIHLSTNAIPGCGESFTCRVCRNHFDDSEQH